MSAAVAGTTFRPPPSYTTLWDVTQRFTDQGARRSDAVTETATPNASDSSRSVSDSLGGEWSTGFQSARPSVSSPHVGRRWGSMRGLPAVGAIRIGIAGGAVEGRNGKMSGRNRTSIPRSISSMSYRSPALAELASRLLSKPCSTACPKLAVSATR